MKGVLAIQKNGVINMWEQILKVYNVKVDRNSEDRAIATYEWATNTLTLALNKLMQDYNPEKIGLSVERGVQNPTPIGEFKLNDKIFLKNMEKSHPELPPLIMERYGVDEDTAKGILVSVNRIHNREIFEASPEIETEEQLEDLYATLAHEGTHFGQYKIPELRSIKREVNDMVDAVTANMKTVIVMKEMFGMVNEEFDIPNEVFNAMAMSIAEMAFGIAVLEIQPAIMDGFNTKPKLKRRIIDDYITPKTDNLLEAYDNLFEMINLTAKDRDGIARIKSFTKNEVVNKIKKYINDMVILKSWEAVVGFDDINKKSKARRKKHSKRTKKKKRRSGDNFKREKDEGLHGWFSRRGGKQKKGGKTQRGWIACGTCGQKGGPKPCGRTDASKGRKRRCRPTCAACKTYKRRKGSP
jgi:hypothetical protein